MAIFTSDFHHALLAVMKLCRTRTDVLDDLLGCIGHCELGVVSFSEIDCNKDGRVKQQDEKKGTGEQVNERRGCKVEVARGSVAKKTTLLAWSDFFALATKVPTENTVANLKLLGYEGKTAMIRRYRPRILDLRRKPTAPSLVSSR